jgi:hypothetical protein
MLTFPAPSADLVAAFNSGDRRAALKARLTYRRDTEVVIEVDGRPLHISPKTDACKTALMFGAPVASPKTDACKTALMFGAPVAVEQDDVDHALAQREIGDRFAMFCAEDGHDGTERADDRCDTCGEVKPGTLFYAPDAMGYPTPVLFTCDCCR